MKLRYLLLSTLLVASICNAELVHKEYKIVSAHKLADRSEIETELNKLARLGWVVKAVVPRVINGANSVTDIYLERDAKEQ